MGIVPENKYVFVSLTTKELFKDFCGAIRACSTPLTDADLFRLVGSLAGTHTDHAAALSFYIKDILVEAGENDLNYGEVLIETYRRLFFDPTYTKYGIFEPQHNEEALRAFVESTLRISGRGVDAFVPPAMVH